MPRRALMICRRRIVVQNAEISPSFKPKVIWLARVNAWRIKVMLSIGGERQKRMVNIGRVRIPFNIQPIVILH